MMLASTTERSIQVIKKTLQDFESLSGLKPNLTKCEVYLAGTSDQRAAEICSCLGMSKGQLPDRYLGVPLLITRLTAKDCQCIIDRITARVKSWAARKLTYGGRLQLIKSVLTVCNYTKVACSSY